MAKSKQCAAEMHAHCDDWSGACQCCHFTCGDPGCGRRTRQLYRRADGVEVCASCYRDATKGRKNTPRCEACGGPTAYRSPRSGDQRFLCQGCHDDAGHVRVDTSGTAAPCAGRDLDDPAHEWAIVRSKRVCLGCHTITYLKPSKSTTR